MPRSGPSPFGGFTKRGGEGYICRMTTTKAEELRLRARDLGEEDPEAALPLYDQALAAEDAAPSTLAAALIGKAVMLTITERADEALLLFDQVIQKYGNSNDIQLRVAVDTALDTKAVQLHKAGSLDEAIGAYDEVVKRNRGRADLESRRAMANALLGKANTFQTKGTEEDIAKAITYFEQVSGTPAWSGDHVLTELVVRSLQGEAWALFAIRRGFVQNFTWWSRRTLFARIDKAIKILAEHFADTDDELLMVARAVTFKAQMLQHFGFAKEAEKTKQVKALTRQFGLIRAKGIAAFIEMEQNLRDLAAHTGTQSFGVVL